MSNRRHDSQAGDRLTKQVIVFTMCLIAVAVTATMCKLSLDSLAIPDQLDRLGTLVVGMVGGWLAKTGVDAVVGLGQRATDSPIEVTAEKPLPTKEVE